MQPPIPTGTVLQNRYRLSSILGQGGFGRTYLAEDLGRFNERCALKEFIPSQSGAYVLDKSKELFQREAAILYQIQHPQIPQFRATFEENQRLFLVQDYVEGKTYRTLLNERKAQGKAFTEAEVLQLMQQLLPVLAHIHSKGIIHRDIAPDNIILRQQDHLPVLIDFGVVKEIVTRVQPAETEHQPTTVGKIGYAPSEQIQSGRAYPNSDLYALAVSAVVLLTGKEPQELYDDRSLTWYWQQWAKVNPGFAQVLNRMLSYRPGDRYQSVSEVAQALQALANPSVVTPPPPPPPTPTSATQAANPTSRMQTVAVGRRPEPTAHSSNAPRRAAGPVIPTQTETSVWDNPWAVAGIVTGLAIVTLITTFAVVSAIRNGSDNTPVATPTPTETATPTPTDEPVEYSQRLNLAPGDTTSVEGTLRENEVVTYIVSAEQAQTLSAAIDGEGVLLSVFAPNGDLVEGNAERVQQWQGVLDFTGEYYLELRPVRGVEESDYRLDLSLEAAPEPEPEPTPTPTETPTPSPSPTPVEPQVDTQRLSFPAGSEGVEVSDTVSDRLTKRYLVNVQEGQVFSAEIIDGAATLNILFPNGEPVPDASNVVFWGFQVPDSGDYIVEVISTDETDFTLGVSATAPTEPPPE
ncbi:serine/threonine protein kinase [Leptolyngbya sp. FACHB-671]|uniref:serine/threonine-protein kinase n=1 Tax=Leptolyngbya sp. FACHB-671 TaxID=2692812 RepID=UPI00168323ED|nr:serine/threonine-protein kinase [Leptolyngbya sp. FACHB-671]MBD2071244.1 serine/threonine protein kinase [Leptolyngbya sp. FACHB-671]